MDDRTNIDASLNSLCGYEGPTASSAFVLRLDPSFRSTFIGSNVFPS
jgi:hypothetical protein